MFRTDLNPLTGHRPNCLFSYFTIKWQVLHFCSFFSTVESHIKCICFNKSLNCFLNTVSVVINNSAQVCHVRYGSFYTKKKIKISNSFSGFLYIVPSSTLFPIYNRSLSAIIPCSVLHSSPSTTSGSGRKLCWLRPSCAARAFS